MYSEQAASKKRQEKQDHLLDGEGTVKIGTGLGSCPPLLDTPPSS